MSQEIVIVDYGMGNLHSIEKKLKHLNVNVTISSHSEHILKADKIILPGVGNFEKENIFGVQYHAEKATT